MANLFAPAVRSSVIIPMNMTSPSAHVFTIDFRLSAPHFVTIVSSIRFLDACAACTSARRCFKGFCLDRCAIIWLQVRIWILECWQIFGILAVSFLQLYAFISLERSLDACVEIELWWFSRSQISSCAFACLAASRSFVCAAPPATIAVSILFAKLASAPSWTTS